MLLNAAARQVADFFGVFRITKAQVGPCAALSPRVAAFRLCNQYREATPHRHREATPHRHREAEGRGDP